MSFFGSLSTVVGDEKLTSREDRIGPLFMYVQSDEDTLLKVGQEVTVKVLEVNAAAERVSLSIKALEERPAQEEGQKEEKRQSRPRRQEKRDFELPETQTGFSMADLFGDIEL